MASAVALLAGAALSTAAAQTQTWIGQSTDFNLSGNWSPTGIPGAGSALLFDHTGSSTAVEVTSSATAGSVTFEASSPAYSLSLGADFLIGGAVTNHSAAEQTFLTSTGHTLTLQGASGSGVTYDLTGGGAVRFSSGASGGASTFDLGGSGMLTLGADAATRVDLGSLVGSGGTVTSDHEDPATVVVGARNASTRFGGILQDGLSILSLEKVGTGTLTLTGANTYSGTTTITGGTLRIGDGGTTGALGSGAVINNATLDFRRSDIVTIENAITGSGQVIQSGTGTTILTGANDYTGTTTISGGTLQIGDGNYAGSLGTGAVVNDGVLAIQFGAEIALANDISGTGRLEVSDPYSFVSLTGRLSYSGGTTIHAGGIALGDDLSSATLPGDATIAADGSLYVFNGSLGSGTITNSGQIMLDSLIQATAGSATIHNLEGSAGIMFLRGASAGSSTINNASMLIFSYDATGASATINNAAGAVTLFQAAASAGAARINNQGIVVFSGQSTAGQATIINDCCLLFTEDASAGSAQITNAAGAVIDFEFNATAANATITNAGTVFFADEATGGTARYIGRPGGVVDFSFLTTQGTTLGSIEGEGTIDLGGRRLTVGGNNLSTEFAGAITDGGVMGGTGGTLTKVGSGTLSLSGVSSYTGATVVEAGTLAVNGSIASSSGVTVAAGATLGGSGLLPAVTIAAGGRLAPGNSIGTIQMSGLTLAAGSTTAIEVLGARADRINVTGLATLGGTLLLLPQDGTYSFATPYTLIQAGSLAGAFATVSTQGSFGVGVTSAVSVTASEVRLQLSPAILLPAEPSSGLPWMATYNRRATAAALDAANRAGANLSPFFQVYNQSAATIGLAVNQLSGEVATAAPAMGFASGEQFLAAMLDPMGYGRESVMGGRLRPASADGAADGSEAAAPHAKRYAVWGAATGAYQRVAGDTQDGSAARTTRTAGFALGLDVLRGQQSLVGVAAAVGESQASLAGGSGTARANFGQIGVHGSTRISRITLAAAAAATFMDIDTRRTLYVLGGARQDGGGGGQVYSFRVEARHDGVMAGGARFQPVAALQAQVMNGPGYTESSPTSGRALGLRVAGQSHASFRSEIGAQVQGAGLVGGRWVQAFARLAWAHYFTRDAAMEVGFAALPGAGFTVRGARPDANAALFSAGLETRLMPGLTLGARLDSEFSGNLRQVAGTARLRYSF